MLQVSHEMLDALSASTLASFTARAADFLTDHGLSLGMPRSQVIDWIVGVMPRIESAGLTSAPHIVLTFALMRRYRTELLDDPALLAALRDFHDQAITLVNLEAIVTQRLGPPGALQ